MDNNKESNFESMDERILKAKSDVESSLNIFWGLVEYRFEQNQKQIEQLINEKDLAINKLPYKCGDGIYWITMGNIDFATIFEIKFIGNIILFSLKQKHNDTFVYFENIKRNQIFKTINEAIEYCKTNNIPYVL